MANIRQQRKIADQVARYRLALEEIAGTVIPMFMPAPEAPSDEPKVPLSIPAHMREIARQALEPDKPA